MVDPDDDCRAKVQAIFRETAGDEAASWLRANVPSRVMDQIADAVSSDYEPQVAARHRVSPRRLAGGCGIYRRAPFVPERFTLEEIDAGVRALLQHVPAHIVAAAKAGGYPAEHIFSDGQTAA